MVPALVLKKGELSELGVTEAFVMDNRRWLPRRSPDPLTLKRKRGSGLSHYPMRECHVYKPRPLSPSHPVPIYPAGFALPLTVDATAESRRHRRLTMPDARKTTPGRHSASCPPECPVSSPYAQQEGPPEVGIALGEGRGRQPSGDAAEAPFTSPALSAVSGGGVQSAWGGDGLGKGNLAG